MYAGHMGFALGAHGLKRSIPLWILVIASQLPDWADAAFCLAGVRPETPGILSHSFPAVAILALAAAMGYAVISRDPAGILIIAAVVISHAVGDYFTGIKPTWSGGPMIGLQLYKRPVVDFIIEAIVVTGGWMIYRRSLPASSRSSRPVFALLTALLVIQIGADILLSVVEGIRKC
jgi:hypothetical protein